MNPSSLSFNTQNNHPLIPREQFYTLDRKFVTIHSEDRDVCKWPDSNHFEIELPEPLQNVQSLRLVESAMPSHFYNISKQFQNTALTYNILQSGTWTPHTIELCDGFYTPSQLACTLTKLMSEKPSSEEEEASVDDESVSQDLSIHVYYDPITQKFVFSSESQFVFDFTKQTLYVPDCENTKPIWCQPTKWGLGSYLGFDKNIYQSVKDDKSSCNLSYCLKDLIHTPTTSSGCEAKNNMLDYSSLSGGGGAGGDYLIVAPKFPKLEGEHVIYMEVDKYDSYDELCPYPTKTNNMFESTYGGEVNAAFAKLYLYNNPSSDGPKTNFDSINNSLLNISYHEPPLERIKKLKFKFRYHNGTLVDFKDVPFSFTIELNQLRNDIEKDYRVRIPYVFM